MFPMELYLVHTQPAWVCPGLTMVLHRFGLEEPACLGLNPSGTQKELGPGPRTGSKFTWFKGPRGELGN